MSEYTEQVTFAAYLAILMRQGKIVLYTAIPNSTWTPSWSVKVKNKKMGLNPGFPDILVILLYRAITIEMKIKPNKPSPEQIKWAEALTQANIVSYVAYGYEEAKTIIDNEIALNKIYYK